LPVSSRPITGCTPSTWKKSPLTHKPCAGRASPPVARLKFAVPQANAPVNAF
jgi:hypothetical protein